MQLNTKKNSENFLESKNILVTGGAGFIGSALIRRLIETTNSKVFNLDKLSYAGNLNSINNLFKANNLLDEKRHELLKVDLTNFEKTYDAIMHADPDIVFHLAAESHVDSSIKNPKIFIQSNVFGTYNLLESIREHYQKLNPKRKESFKFHHISTDEVFGSLSLEGKFDEESQYKPQSPYSASKASSDHLVKAWGNTFDIPTLITNCSNNYGPWQHPEKLIPLAIKNALNEEQIPLYGNGENIRDWLYVEDHIDALLLVASIGIIGETYCIGGNSEIKNKDILLKICNLLEEIIPNQKGYSRLITHVKDRKGHDFRYAINNYKIKKNLGWEPKHNFEEGIRKTINWYIKYYES